MHDSWLEKGARTVLLGALGAVAACQPSPPAYDVLIKSGQVADGSGGPMVTADVGIRDGRIAKVGDLSDATATETIDAAGRVVSPGFIDMHTHSEYALLKDGRGLSKSHQGVTLEVFGEGSSPGPRHEGMQERRGGYGVEPTWTTLEGYFEKVQEQGISVNAASYVSAGTAPPLRLR